VEISSVSVWALVVVVAINTLFIGGLAVAFWMINKKLDDAIGQLQPLIKKSTETLQQVSDATAKLQPTVDALLDKTTHVVDAVADRVDRTSAAAEDVVSEPLIGAASVVAGMHRALQVYAERSQGPNGHTNE
jgi:predicted PurR-regulated permease PerM